LKTPVGCVKALSYTPRPNYKRISVILYSGQDKQTETQIKPPTSNSFGFVRGANYYKKGGAGDADFI